MTEVKVLIEGYAYEKDKIFYASCSTVLVREGKINIIVDPGCNRKLLLRKLKEEDLETKDIHFVFNTHMHQDHSLLSGIFENAKFLDNDIVFDGDKEYSHNGIIPGTNLKILKTPGHDQFHCSLIVKNSKGDKIAIAGDVFWWEDAEEQKTDKSNLMSHEDPYVKNKEQLAESRKKLLELADYIIPGHGKMFRVQK